MDLDAMTKDRWTLNRQKPPQLPGAQKYTCPLTHAEKQNFYSK